jgi:hypothetical protein
MTLSTPLYAYCLRAIGQSLDLLRIDSFELETRGADYLVHMELNERTKSVSVETGFLKSIAKIVWGTSDSDEKSLEPRRVTESIVYNTTDVHWLDLQGRSKRGRLNASQETHEISQGLRIIGDYLDRQKASAYAVSWTKGSAIAKYQTSDGKEERQSFIASNLHDLGVQMHLRRSKRQHK